MEAISLGIGVAGLAGLFSACVDCFDLVQRGRYLGKEYLLLETKYTNQRLRFVAWGRACGFLDKSGYDAGLEDDEVQKCIQDNLVHIFNLLHDGKRLMTRYGLKEERETSPALLAASSALETLIPWKSVPSTTFGRRLQGFRDRAKSTQKQAKLSGSARWAIDDRRKFVELVQHLKDLIDDLESVTISLGISRRYRELVRFEVESICDIQTLEAMEEARWGTDDEISDAASHRLWLLRDQYDGPEKGPLTADLATHGKDDDWEEIATGSDPTSSPPRETIYQTLHRVSCPLQPTTIFFDQPSYQIFDQNENQWVYLDTRQKTSSTTSLHLSGARPVPNFEAYLAQNSPVQFILFKDYTCCHDSDQRQTADLGPTQHSVHLVSPELCSALSAYFKGITLFEAASVQPSLKVSDMLPDLHKGLELGLPWAWFYHSIPDIYDKVRRHCQIDMGDLWPWHSPGLDEQEAKSVLVLMNTIKYISGGTFSRFDDLRQNNKITWVYLPFIFTPGKPLVANQNKHKDYHQLYRLKSFPKLLKSSTGSEYLELTVQYYQYNGSMKQPTLLTFSIHREQFGETGDSEVSIEDLVIYPLDFSTSISLHDIAVRARTFWDVGPGQGSHFKWLSESESFAKSEIGDAILAWRKAPAHVVGYLGSTAEGAEYITQRKFVIDVMNYTKLRDHPHNGRRLPSLQRDTMVDGNEAEARFQAYIRDKEDSYEDIDADSLDEDDAALAAIFANSPEVDIRGDPTLLLPPTIIGFDIEDHQWKELLVENLRHIQWRRVAEDDLIMDEGKKKVLLSFFNKAPSSRFVLLFHGSPGTGKSFAVEAIAEYAKKAVYKLNLADIGMTARDIETHLSQAITLTNAWGCILLIEDIGSVFRQRLSGERDFEQDSKLSAFVRLVDELKGILILTSREAPINLDGALRSRVHHIVPFGLKRTDHTERTRIWTRQLKSMLSSDDYSNISDIERLGTIDLQGWEIHNAISTAQQIAVSKDRLVDYETLVLAVENLTGRGPLHG